MKEGGEMFIIIFLIWLLLNAHFAFDTKFLQIVIIGLLLSALIYWSYGFTLYVVFQPMPFLVGYYIMNHRIILGISWCIEAILIYVSFET